MTSMPPTEPPDHQYDVDDEPYDDEGAFLSELWMHLDRAEELSTVPEALQNLDQVESHCEAVIDLIRAWRVQQAGGPNRQAP